MRTLLLLLAGLLFLALFSSSALASDAVSVRQAIRHERAAHRALVRARAEYRTSRDVARWTRIGTAQYGWKTGRWVWLAEDVGWPRSSWRQLLYIIHRESGGSPGAKNPASTASGLLQFLAFWWDGTGDYGWCFDPFSPRESLRHGYLAWRELGWSPWSL